MEITWKITAVCLIFAVFALLLRRSNPEIAILLVLAVALAVLAVLVSMAEDVLRFITRVLESVNLPMDLFSPLLKTLIIGWISCIGAELCRDAGQTALGTVTEMAGTVCAVIAAIPLFEAIWDALQMLL